MQVRGKSFAHVGVELPRGNDFSVKLTQEEFAESLNLSSLPRSCGNPTYVCPLQMRSSCVGVNWENWFDQPQLPDRIFARGWLPSPLELIFCRAGIFIASTIWSKP